MAKSRTMAPPEDLGALLDLVSTAYSYRINECGPVANGVFWKDEDGQTLRHELLLQAIPPDAIDTGFTVNDLGCGYGALWDLMVDHAMQPARYYGYDISPVMIETALAAHPDARAQFFVSPVATETADYSFVSGTYNMNLGAKRNLWTE